MDRIIAGRFQTRAEAEFVSASLSDTVGADDVCIFFNNPPGQHDMSRYGGDGDEDPDATGATRSAVTTALAGAVAGAALGAIGGPSAAFAGAAVGAYTGAFAGALDHLGEIADPRSPPERRASGVMLSIRIRALTDERRVIRALTSHGARDIERAQGEWSGGDWTSFDASAAPRLVPLE